MLSINWQLLINLWYQTVSTKESSTQIYCSRTTFFKGSGVDWVATLLLLTCVLLFHNINAKKWDALHDLTPFIQFKNVKNIHGGGGVLLLVKLQDEVCNFAKSIIPPWVFFTFFKIVQIVPNSSKASHLGFTISWDDSKKWSRQFDQFFETLKKMWNLFKVNNKDTRTTSLTLCWCLYY